MALDLVIKHMMKVRGYRLADLIGSPHASEVLNHSRPVTLQMIQILSANCKFLEPYLCPRRVRLTE